MGKQANWVSNGPDTMQLEAVLASGLHDGLHEDQLEDMRLRGAGDALQKGVVAGRMPATASQRVIEAAATIVPHAVRPQPMDRAWFAKMYPKLKPEDLAEFYREQQQDVDVPVRTGTTDTFELYKRRLADHVRNANISPDDRTVVVPVQIQAELAIAPELLSRHRSLSDVRRDQGLPRTGIIALLTSFAVISGALVGLGLSSPAGIAKFVNFEQITGTWNSLVAPTLRN